MSARTFMISGLLLWGVAAFALTRWCGIDIKDRNVRYSPDMADSPAYTAQEPRDSAIGGAYPRSLPKGVVPRGLAPFPFPNDDAGRALAGRTLENPFAVGDTKALARGQAVFQAMCTACHGREGRGDGTVTKRGFPPPPSLLVESAMNLRDGEIYHIITYGRKNMASHAAQVARDDRWRVVLYIRTLQGKSK